MITLIAQWPWCVMGTKKRTTLTSQGLSSVHHYQCRRCVAHKRPLLNLREGILPPVFLISGHRLRLHDMVAPELLSDLPERDAQTECGEDIKGAELQGEPSERCDGLEEEAVEFDGWGE